MALGKKLDTLLENYFGTNAFAPEEDRLAEIEIFKIITSPYQPRSYFDEANLQALAQNIANHGLLQPVTVIDLEDGVFQLISGERRLRAFKILQKTTIPAIVKSKSNLDEKQQATLGIFENLHRENLTAIDTAKAFVNLKKMHSWSNQDLANFLRCSKQHIENYLRLFDLSPAVQEALAQNQITEGHARLLHQFDFYAQDQILAAIIAGSLSVKASKNMINKMFQIKKPTPIAPEIKDTLAKWQAKFPKNKVVINGSPKRGSLIIKWSNQADFPLNLI